MSDGQARQAAGDQLTSEEIAAFLDKLEQWAKTLPEREQVIAQAIAKRLREEDDDVAGFFFGLGFAGLALRASATTTTLPVAPGPPAYRRGRTLDPKFSE